MSTQSEHAIVAEHVSRAFRSGRSSHVALRDVNFVIDHGTSVALLGRNGAGKTTLARILATLLTPTQGHAFVAGFDVVRQTVQARSRLGVVFGGDKGLYGLLSGWENLQYFGTLAGLTPKQMRSQGKQLLDQLGLLDAADRRVEEYSRGMKQRLHIAIGLVARPPILVLDEPTIGLDPVEAARLREHVALLRSTGITLLLTSHHLADIEVMADRVLMLQDGAISHDLSVGDFTRLTGYEAQIDLRWHSNGDAVSGRALREPGVTLVQRDGANGTRAAEISVSKWTPATMGSVARFIHETAPDQIDVHRTSLEDAFELLVDKS